MASTMFRVWMGCVSAETTAFDYHTVASHRRWSPLGIVQPPRSSQTEPEPKKIVASEPYAFIIVLLWACCCSERNWENRWSEAVCENGEESRHPIIRRRG